MPRALIFGPHLRPMVSSRPMTMSVWAGTKAATSRRSRRPATARDDHFARPRTRW